MTRTFIFFDGHFPMNILCSVLREYIPIKTNYACIERCLGQEIELAMHDGTVRDICFLEDTSNKSSLLISGGAGDCKIYVTDCATGQPYQALSGHSGKFDFFRLYDYV